MSLRKRGVIASTALLVAAAFGLAMPATARADGASPDGAWTMSDLTETFTVQQWSGPCGPPPVSGTLVPGGPVTVTSQGGELVIDGRLRVLRTDQCLDPLQTLVREAHSGDGHAWRTRCATPQSDPRRATVNAAYFLSPTDDTLSLAETGRYEFRISESRCVADVRREGTAKRVLAPPPVATATATATASATSTATSTATCTGDPARLEMRPSHKLLRLGDTFAFRAVVLDGSGCPTGTPIQWSIASLRFRDGQPHAGQPLVDPGGKLTVPGTDFPDATFDVVVTAAGRSARASVQTTSQAGYEALLAQSGLDSNGERGEAAVAILATTSIGASDVRAEDGARRRRIGFIAVVGGLALALGAVGLVARRRARTAQVIEQAAVARHSDKMRDYERQKQEREEQHASQMKAHLESVARAQQMTAAAARRGASPGRTFCPSCRREFTGGGGFCPFDANRLVAITGHENLMTGPAGGICPTCKRGFNPGVKVCPHDGDELAPAGIAAAPGVPTRGKICPTCGDRFDGAAGFCGKDGTQLVLLN